MSKQTKAAAGSEARRAQIDTELSELWEQFHVADDTGRVKLESKIDKLTIERAEYYDDEPQQQNQF